MNREKKVEKNIEIIKREKKVKIFGVEGNTIVLGVNIPIDGKRYYLHLQ